MARVKLELPEHFIFSTELEIRISEINYGGHLGNDSVLSLIHEARLRFLKHHGFSEQDVGGYGIIMVDAVIAYKSQGFHGDVLTVAVTVADVSKSGCDFYYHMKNKDSGKEVIRAKTGVVFFDYQQQKVVGVPQIFKAVLEKN